VIFFRLLTLKISYPILLLLCGSCSHWIGHFQSTDDYRQQIVGTELLEDDYVDHLASLSQDYLSTPDVSSVTLSKRSQFYLENLYNKIVQNNELVFSKRQEPRFFIIKDETPFYFSLPKAQFFFSSGLIRRYFRNEELLVASLTHEIFKSHRAIYQKNTIVPLGYMQTERMLALTRVPVEVKVELNKLSFYAMRRAKRDASAYLNWLQTQNKNTLDFSMQLGDARSISREEFMFKNFLVSEGQVGFDGLEFEENSSPGFYVLLRELERI
jgi:hypothetical protein